MLEHLDQLGLRPESLGADKAYGSGEFLAWLLGQGIQPHIPVIDRRHQTGKHFTRDQFRYAPDENAYYCPAGQPLRYRRIDDHKFALYSVGLDRKDDGGTMPAKDDATSGAWILGTEGDWVWEIR